jgi:hypothetical protein
MREGEKKSIPIVKSETSTRQRIKKSPFFLFNKYAPDDGTFSPFLLKKKSIYNEPFYILIPLSFFFI